ncbi:MAG: hypothetical protein ACOCRK_04570 [bacterium]
MKKIKSIVERLKNIEIVGEEENDYGRKFNVWEIKADSLLLVTNVSPRKMENLDKWDIYRIFIPDRKIKKEYDIESYLRVGHAFPHNKGAILLRYNRPIKVQLYSGSDNVDKVLPSFGGKELKTEVKDLFKQASKVKIVSNFVDNVLKKEETPEVVQSLIDNYVATGERVRLKRAEIEEIKNWYRQTDFYDKAPKKVYRGIGVGSWDDSIDKIAKTFGVESTEDLKKGGNYKYRHRYNHPISTTTSRKVPFSFISLTDLGIIIEMEIDPDDIIIDLRFIENDHPAQTEVILDYKKKYDVKIINLNYME